MNQHFANRPISTRTMKNGFSLIELMIVVAIIAILATLAMPRFKTFQARARQSESRVGLNQIYTLQTVYKDDPDNTANVYLNGALALSTAINTSAGACRNGNALGFSVSDCTQVRYVYSLNSVLTPMTLFTGVATETGSRVTGVTGVTGCQVDTWTIDQDSHMSHTQDGPKTCL